MSRRDFEVLPCQSATVRDGTPRKSTSRRYNFGWASEEGKLMNGHTKKIH